MNYFNCVCAACGEKFIAYTSYGMPKYCGNCDDDFLASRAHLEARRMPEYKTLVDEKLMQFKRHRDEMEAERCKTNP